MVVTESSLERLLDRFRSIVKRIRKSWRGKPVQRRKKRQVGRLKGRQAPGEKAKKSAKLKRAKPSNVIPFKKRRVG